MFVRDEDLEHGGAFIGIGHEDFEDVESFVLNHSSMVTQQLHAQFEVLALRHVGGHDSVIGAVEEDLAQQFDGLPFSHVRVRVEEETIVEAEEAGKVGCEVWRDNLFVPDEDFLRSDLVSTEVIIKVSWKRTRKVVKASALVSKAP